MARTCGTARRGWPGLTLIELLMAILLTGATFALLLPRLAPVPASIESQGCCHWRTLIPLGPELAEQGFIGVQLDPQPTEDGYARIRGLLLGRPAHEAGVLPGDAILRVDGVSLRNRRIDEVVQTITRGRPGTLVRLTVRRSGAADTRELRARRGSFLSVFLPGIAADW